MPQGYLLVLTEKNEGLSDIEPILMQMENPQYISIANSVDQANYYIRRFPPYLVILVGYQKSWAKNFVRHCRQESRGSTTIVALTYRDDPVWISSQYNPGFDGFLVWPISPAVLLLLIQSAQVRQSCCLS